MPMHFDAVIDSVIEASPSINIVHIAPQIDIIPVFHAGQYAYVQFPGFDPKPFSIAARPGQNILEFHIRNSGAGASAHVAAHLKKGDPVSIEMPFGTCFYKPEKHKDGIIVIAGGSGLSQAKAIIEQALHAKTDKSITLYAGTRTKVESYLHEFFLDISKSHANVRYVPALSDEILSGFSHGVVGALAAQDIALDDPSTIFIAGPPIMVRYTAQLLYDKGIAKTKIHSDLLDIAP